MRPDVDMQAVINTTVRFLGCDNGGSFRLLPPRGSDLDGPGWHGGPNEVMMQGDIQKHVQLLHETSLKREMLHEISFKREMQGAFGLYRMLLRDTSAFPTISYPAARSLAVCPAIGRTILILLGSFTQFSSLPSCD